MCVKKRELRKNSGGFNPAEARQCSLQHSCTKDGTTQRTGAQPLSRGDRAQRSPHRGGDQRTEIRSRRAAQRERSGTTRSRECSQGKVKTRSKCCDKFHIVINRQYNDLANSQQNNDFKCSCGGLDSCGHNYLRESTRVKLHT